MTDTLTLGQAAVDTKPEPDDLICHSVTTIIGCLDKPALLYWAAEQSAIAAVHNRKTWEGMLEDDDTDCDHKEAASCSAVKWLRDARFRRPKDLLSAADLGTAAHKACEQYALTGTRPSPDELGEMIRDIGGRNVKVDLELPVLSKMLDQFDGWLQRFSPSYQATEVAVYSPTYRYAGQSDGFLTVDGVRFIIDYKTSRNHLDGQGKPRTPYSEVALQLAAYRHAEMAAVWRPRRTEKFRRRYYLLSAAEQEMAVPVPEVDGGLVIHITPESCEAYPVRCDTTIHTAFLYVLEVARWSFDLSKHVIGEPLEAA